ncbi:interferon kappa [Phascolarctos cinereus]|uniref:Interferon kappa n=1 Tax=Phascolarctos cinereus TaxID=38626 RepID=A0A6P5J5P7_PHACI|nr:interferon kappa [Phascolarctos cinereus]
MSNIQKCLKSAYFFLLVISVSSLDCNLLYSYLRNVNWEAMILLSKMNKEFPRKCLSIRMDFEFSQELLPPDQSLKDVKIVIYEMSQHIFNIFSQNYPPHTWEVENIQKIQIGLDQQIEYLQKCLEEDEKEKEELEKEVEDEISYSGLAILQLNNLELKRYFKTIGSFLKEKKYSHCAWEIVRLEMRRCFYILQKLISQLK